MAKTFIEDLRDGMVLLGLGGGDVVYPGPRPDTARQADCATIIMTGGPPPLLDNPLRDVAIQLAIYHTAPAIAMARAEAAYTVLHGKNSWTLTDHVVLVVRAMQPPYQLPVEEGRARVVTNYLLTARAK